MRANVRLRSEPCALTVYLPGLSPCQALSANTEACRLTAVGRHLRHIFDDSVLSGDRDAYLGQQDVQHDGRWTRSDECSPGDLSLASGSCFWVTVSGNAPADEPSQWTAISSSSSTCNFKPIFRAVTHDWLANKLCLTGVIQLLSWPFHVCN